MGDIKSACDIFSHSANIKLNRKMNSIRTCSPNFFRRLSGHGVLSDAMGQTKEEGTRKNKRMAGTSLDELGIAEFEDGTPLRLNSHQISPSG